MDGVSVATAQAENRRNGSLSALRTHTKAPYKCDLRLETLRLLKHPRRARTVGAAVHEPDAEDAADAAREQRDLGVDVEVIKC
jgi:hypothetical protein